jgi:hypothetical protein
MEEILARFILEAALAIVTFAIGHLIQRLLQPEPSV